jgi:acetyltransferase-like isoleucine patch superfamily enzyme
MRSKEFPLNRSIIPRKIETPIRYILKKLAIRNNVEIGGFARVSRGVVVSAPNQLIIGTNVSIGPYSMILVDGAIGSWTILSFRVLLVGKNDHGFAVPGSTISNSHWSGRNKLEASEKIFIGKDVWVGAGAILIAGIEIGDGAIIGAGSVVTSNVPACEIYAGNPAKFIRSRFESEEEKETHLSFLRSLK